MEVWAPKAAEAEEELAWNAPALSIAEPLYLGAFIAAGIPAISMLAGLTTLIQTGVSDLYLGRVFATFVTTSNSLQALGMLLGGLLADPIGVVPVLNGQAALYLLCGVIALLTLKPPPERAVTCLTPAAEAARPGSTRGPHAGASGRSATRTTARSG